MEIDRVTPPFPGNVPGKGDCIGFAKLRDGDLLLPTHIVDEVVDALSSAHASLKCDVCGEKEAKTIA